MSVEVPRDLRRHPDAARLTWLAAFVHLRARSLTDDLVDLLIETIHQIGARAERKVERELLDDLRRVTGKQNLLFERAGSTLAQPDGVVRDVVFPVVGEQTLRDLVKEWKATGPTYRVTLRTVIRNSYRRHYRRMVSKLLDALEFRSNNDRHRPVMQALELVKRFADTQVHSFPPNEEVPLDGVVRSTKVICEACRLVCHELSLRSKKIAMTAGSHQPEVSLIGLVDQYPIRLDVDVAIAVPWAFEGMIVQFARQGLSCD